MSSTRTATDAERIEECRRRAVRHVQCRYCGYEPAGQHPACCPKCHGGCWESFVQVGKLRPAEGEDPQPAAEGPITAHVAEGAGR